MNSMLRFAAIGAVLLSCVSGAQAEVVIETVTVGNPGNAGELSGECVPNGYGPCRECGAVDYAYNIGTFELTAGQYTEFLNAVAATDTYGLYNPNMDSSSYGCQITQNGTSRNFTYDFSGRPSGTEADWADRPVNYVSWGDAARFCNWLHNGQPGLGAPVPQDENSTEDGSYYLNGATSDAALLAVVRNPDATWVIPSEDEWYKAAYYDGGSGVYYDYPTGTDDVPSNVLSDPDPDPGNNANFYDGGYTIGSPYYRTVGGDFENSESPYDAFDQGGNVWEWNEAVIGSDRGLRGGCFHGNDGYLYLRAAYRHGDDPSLEQSVLGFRVATFADCNNNGVPDECDLDCKATIGATGGSCSIVYPGCGTSVDENGNGVLDDCAPDIPTISEWALVAMALLVLTAGTAVLAQRRRVSTRVG